MKIISPKLPTTIDVTLTLDEAVSLMRLIGETSVTQLKDLGLTEDEAYTIGSMFTALYHHSVLHSLYNNSEYTVTSPDPEFLS
jgi:hypothetical protein